MTLNEIIIGTPVSLFMGGQEPRLGHISSNPFTVHIGKCGYRIGCTVRLEKGSRSKGGDASTTLLVTSLSRLSKRED